MVKPPGGPLCPSAVPSASICITYNFAVVIVGAIIENWIVYIGIAIIVVIVAVMFLFLKKPKRAEDEEDELELFEDDEI